MARISMFGMGKHLYRERCSVYLLSLLTNFIYTGARCNTGGLSEFEQMAFLYQLLHYQCKNSYD